MNFGLKKLIYNMPKNIVHIDTLLEYSDISNEILQNMKRGGLEYIPISKRDNIFLLQELLENFDLYTIGGVIIAQSVPFKLDIDFPFPKTTISGQPCAITHLAIDLATQWCKDIKKDILIIGIDKNLSINKRLYFNSAMGDIVIIGVISQKNIIHKILSIYSDSYIFADEGEFSEEKDILNFREHNPLLIRENIFNNLQKANLSLEDIKYIFPHTPYLQIWDIMAKVLRYPREKIWTKYINRTGHLNSNDSFFHYLKAIEENIVKKGDIVLLINNGFGGSRGSTIIKYRGQDG